MKPAVSNIVWGADDLPDFLDRLADLGCVGVELAPSLVWPEPLEADAAARRRLRQQVEGRGLRVAGLHSLFYTRPDLRLFGTSAERDELIAYARGTIRLCADVDGEVLIWGSPRNRARGALAAEAAVAEAVPVFRSLADAAATARVTLCIEPLGRNETDFIRSCDEGAELVRLVNHPHFRLHLDAKALLSNGEEPGAVMRAHGSLVRHVHVGDPGLAPPGSTGCDHALLATALRAAGYAGYVSVEVRRGFGRREDVLRQCVETLRTTYLTEQEVSCPANSH